MPHTARARINFMHENSIPLHVYSRAQCSCSATYTQPHKLEIEIIYSVLLLQKAEIIHFTIMNAPKIHKRIFIAIKIQH